jgi:hypothetical protein
MEDMQIADMSSGSGMIIGERHETLTIDSFSMSNDDDGWQRPPKLAVSTIVASTTCMGVHLRALKHHMQ